MFQMVTKFPAPAKQLDIYVNRAFWGVPSTLANKATRRLTTRTHPGLQHPIPYPNNTKKIDVMLDYKDKIAFKYERKLFDILWWLSAHSDEWNAGRTVVGEDGFDAWPELRSFLESWKNPWTHCQVCWQCSLSHFWWPELKTGGHRIARFFKPVGCYTHHVPFFLFSCDKSLGFCT